jgi:hypothetical protein
MMRRRDLIAMLGATIAGSGAAQSDERSRRRLGVLAPTSGTDAEWQPERAAFTSARSAFGWREGQNMKIDLPLRGWQADGFPGAC